MKNGGKPVALWGAGGHAKGIAEALRLLGLHPAVSVQAPSPALAAGPELLCERDPRMALERLKALGITRVALAFGHCAMRETIGRLVQQQGLELVSVVHPTAFVASTARLGCGVTIGARCIVDAEVQVGDFAKVLNGAVLCHETRVGVACCIGPGVVLSGRCEVGDLAWVGAGCVLKDGVRIGRRAFVGTGSTVVKDIPPGMLAYGNPAKPVKPSPEAF